MVAFIQLPTELIYEIALHLPLTRDVLAFSLTNSYIRANLSTPSLFKRRLESQGWDVSAWHDGHDDDVKFSGDLERWMRIDYIYCRTTQLFEEAAEVDYFVFKSEGPVSRGVVWGSGSGLPDPTLDVESLNQGPDSCRALDGEKTAIWLRKLSKVLPSFVTHHRGGNISRITGARYHNVLWAYTRVIADLCTITSLELRVTTIQARLDPSEYDWFESVCFSVTALLMHCDTSTIISIFADTWTDITSLILDFHVFWFLKDPVPDLNTYFIIAPQYGDSLKRVSKRYFAVFFIQTTLFIALHLDAARTGMPRHSLLAPSLTHLDPGSFTYFTYFTYSAHFRFIDVSTSTHVRPWLRNGLAGTPFAELSLMTGRPWVGYYTHMGNRNTEYDPPMFLELRSEVRPPPHAEPNTVYFRGEGHDSIGAFSISGTCNTRTGVVMAIKAYETHQWEWRGMMTPFGMAGMWGYGWRAGWWWIWPREWSPAVDSHAAR